MNNIRNLIIVNQIKKTLSEGGYTCVIAKGEQILTTKHRGVKPLLDWLDEGADLSDAFAADKVVGKAAAYLYVLLGVRFVYAAVISKPALDVFARYDIEAEYDTLVDAIQNRTQTGFCPMERAVWTVEEPEGVPELLKKELSRLASISVLENQQTEKANEELFTSEMVRQWPICQIEDKRAELFDEQTSSSDVNQNMLKKHLEILNAEKKRRGYK